jgi:nucleoid DNA-binding protein
LKLTELISKISRRHSVPKELAGGFILDAIEEIARAIDSGESVKIQGLGTFYWQKVKGRRGTGAFLDQIPEGWKLKFIPAKHLRARRKHVGR